MRLLPSGLLYAAILTAASLTFGNFGYAQQSTTATYSDWVLQCATLAGPPPTKTCAISQVTQVKGKNIPFSRVSIDAPKKAQSAKLTIQLPVNVSLHSPVVLKISAKAKELAAPFDLCIPGGCFATLDLKEETLNVLFRSDETIKLSFKDSGGHEVAFPFSTKGLQASFEALLKE